MNAAVEVKSGLRFDTLQIKIQTNALLLQGATKTTPVQQLVKAYVFYQ